jgi:hypothetical protein
MLFAIGFFNKIQGRRINTVAHPGRGWPVRKNMTQMSVTVPAEQFHSPHTVTKVRALNDIRLFKFRMKARPTATCVKLAARMEQGFVTANAVIMSLVPVRLVLAAERRFSTGFPGYAVLFIVQLLAPFFITFMLAHVDSVNFLSEYD